MPKRKEKKEGKIHVTVIDGDRLAAIRDLSEAINKVATALSSVPHVTISSCTIASSDIGIAIDTGQEKTETREFTVRG